jgi:hypothetical protein
MMREDLSYGLLNKTVCYRWNVQHADSAIGLRNLNLPYCSGNIRASLNLITDGDPMCFDMSVKSIHTHSIHSRYSFVRNNSVVGRKYIGSAKYFL